MLWQRLLFGSLMIAAVVVLMLLDARVSTPAGTPSVTTSPVSIAPISPFPVEALPVTLLVAILVVLASCEIGKLCSTGGHAPATAWAAFVSAGLVLVPWIEMHARIRDVGPLLTTATRQFSPTIIWTTGGTLGACLVTLSRKTTERALSNMAITVFIFLYVGLLGSFWVRIRCLLPGVEGALLMGYVLLTVKAGDMGAYFTGLAIGRHKLCPWLSPGKTVEGVGGAIIGSVLVAITGMPLWPFLTHHPSPLTSLQAIALGVLMAVSGHLGDLVESAFKRDLQIKDSGQLIPAFGGLLDLFDSPLFAAPVAWLTLTFWG